MEGMSPLTEPSSERPPIDWQSFYVNFRKPGYITGFEIINKLGGGVFGLVYKARKESIGKDYAIKFLKVDDEVVRDAVVRELETVKYFAQIDHPNLVSIEDKGEVDGIPFIVMSYAGESTLRKRLESGRMSREDALMVFVQAARGIQAIHDHSLVHFDLKPANIFLRGDIARVGDYGLSKLVTESRNSLSFGRGTPYYMAPEMLQRVGDIRSDIYSLGVILFECLTGDVPFKGDTEWQVLRKHETEDPTFPPEVEDRERQVISRCMAKNPDERYQTVAEILADLQAPASLGESVIIPPGARDPRPHAAHAAAAAAAEASQAAYEASQETTAALHPEEPAPRLGVIGGLIRVIFSIFELAIFVVLAPVRILSVVFGQGLLYVLKIPLRLLGALMRIFGYLLIIGLLVGLAAVLFTALLG
jgi:serine/threonine protein kinase